MASFNKVNDFIVNAVHNMDLESDQIVVALSNTAPASESSDPSTDGNGILGNVTEISYTNCSSRNVTTTSSSQSSGTYKLILTDLTLTASGGSVGPFRYIYIYNDTVTSPADPVIGYYDYSSSLTLNDGDSFTVDFNATNGVLQLA
ncbi:MAG: hypothetical protein Unbinned4497contig1000_37 [Prokaryotic dsDNA virus sp.]|nr:MAG: hypothetical protein Unbinned4497contig1000_37 [Prokaryotic dsDNA virus sp.]|tara:strand:+ start:285 stop:722 length:438 start_codon:yes stop_codon:yes gene_type:complete